MVIGFWNINNNTDLGDILIDFVKENSIDVLLLAESDFDKNNNRDCIIEDIILDFLTKSKKHFLRNYHLLPNNDFRVKILTSYSPDFFKQMNSLITSSRWTAFLVEIPGIIKFNLFPVHFYSKVNWSETSLALECVNFARDIEIIEKHTNISESILIGDFNMSPFENGIVAANGINGQQDLEYISQKLKGREIDGRYYKYFYNPMWNFLGDNKKPIGTHYHRLSGHISHEWHCYDQILIRPEMKNFISKNSVKIITSVNGQTLLKKYNRPNKDYSDHLPITINLIV